MKRNPTSAYAALLLAVSVLTTSCEKAAITPELPTSGISQNVALDKEKGLEIRVEGTVNATGEHFMATLRVNAFVNGGPGSLFTRATFQQVGGGLSNAQKAILESTQLTYFMNIPSYYSGQGLDVNSYTFGLDPNGLVAGAGAPPVVTLDAAYTITLDEKTPKYRLIASKITDILGLYTPGAATTGQYGGGLNGAGIAQLTLYLDEIAALIGRY